ESATYEASLLEPSALTVVPLTLHVKPSKKSQKKIWSLELKYLSQSLKSEITANGEVIEERSDLAGLPIIATPVTLAEYSKLELQGTKSDLVELAKVDFPVIAKPKESKRFSVKLRGIETSSFQLNRHRQTLKNDVLTVAVEPKPTTGSPVQSLVGRKDLEPYLSGDTSIPVY